MCFLLGIRHSSALELVLINICKCNFAREHLPDAWNLSSQGWYTLHVRWISLGLLSRPFHMKIAQSSGSISHNTAARYQRTKVTLQLQIYVSLNKVWAFKTSYVPRGIDIENNHENAMIFSHTTWRPPELGSYPFIGPKIIIWFRTLSSCQWYRRVQNGHLE